MTTEDLRRANEETRAAWNQNAAFWDERMGEGNEDENLKNATLNSLKVADENNLKSISFPAISTGIFGYPIQRCAEIMLSTTIDYLKGQTGLENVVFCLFGRDSYQVFENQLKEITK